MNAAHAAASAELTTQAEATPPAAVRSFAPAQGVARSPGEGSEPHAYLSIGQVLGMLKEEFPGITVSKVRFLETEGLVEPKRTESNYRKFSREDVDRLRYVLRTQRDHYLPLRVIRSHLESMDRGFEPPTMVGEPQVPQQGASTQAQSSSLDLRASGTDLRLSRGEMLRETGLTDPQLRELETFGLIEAQGGHFDADALETATTVSRLMKYGDIGGRHLARFRNAADREIDLCSQVVTPIMRQRGPDSRGRAEETASELSELFVQLHAGLVRNGVRRLMDGD